MKKKLLTVALAATMVVSSLGSAFAAGESTTENELTVEGFLTSTTTPQSVSGDFDVTYTFKNQTQGTENYHNVALVVASAETPADKVIARLDRCVFGQGEFDAILGAWGAHVSWGDADPVPVVWDTFKTLAANADVTFNVKRVGKVITINTKATDGINSFETIAICPETTDADMTVCLSGEKVKLTDIVFTDNKAVVDEPESPAESETPTEPANPSQDDPANPGDDQEKPTSGNPEDPTSGNPEDPTSGNPEDPTTEPENPSPKPGTVDVSAVADIAKVAAVVENAADGVEIKVAETAEEVVATVEKLVNANEKLQAAKPSVVKALDLNLFKGDKQLKVLDGKINVTLSAEALFGEDAKADAIVAVYRLDKKNDADVLSFLGNSKITDGKITFATDHFSTYVFALVEAEVSDDVVTYKDVDPEAQVDAKVADLVKDDASTDPNGKTGDSAAVLPIVVLAGAAALGLAVVAMKKKNA